MNFPMRIVYRLLSGAALLSMPYFSTAQVTKATDDYVQTTVNATPITIRVLDNDSVRNGRRLKVDYIPLINHGKARITADSSAIEFTPERDFRGIALINYTISDGDGAYDCGLAVIDVASTPTPNSQEMNLFTRKGRAVRFTMPNGFASDGSVANGTVEMVRGYTGVYQFTPNAAITGRFDLLFSKIENGIAKDFHVIVEVLNAPSTPLYLKDQYHTLNINGFKTVDLLSNMAYYPLPIASVDALPLTNPNDCSVTRADRTNVKKGDFNIEPAKDFKGTLRFDYKVTYMDGFEETATVHLTVSNFIPAASEFTITSVAGQTQVLPYKVPADFTQYTFEVSNPVTLNGGTIEFTRGELVYTAPRSNATIDAFSLKYCVDGDCHPVDVNVKLLPASNVCTDGRCIWAGDANQDGHVDIADIFPIGENIGQYGFKRNSTSDAWLPQSADNWRIVSADVADPKYADTNGDGMVTITDTTAILKNYGLSNSIYPERMSEESKLQSFLITSVQSVKPGDMIEILVLLGSADNPALDTRGLSFSVDYSATKIDESTLVVDFGKFNWLSRYDAFLTASKVPKKGTVDAGIVRSLDRGASGHGEVGKIRAIVIEDQAGLQESDKPVVRFKLKDAVIVGSHGRTTKVKGCEIAIPLETGKKDVAVQESDVIMFPNPTSDFAEFYLNGYNTIQSIRILDMRGREVRSMKNINGKQSRIDLSEMTNGLYMAEVMTENGRVVKKLQVIK
jgi:Secretion system C-terminal sorting domain/Bacterial Ig domain